MAKPKVLDLFCGAGGAAMGYHNAGYEIEGVDIEYQKNYPFKFHALDALDALDAGSHKYDLIHASPPCQKWARQTLKKNKKKLHNLIDIIRPKLIKTGIDYVIENIEGSPLNPYTIKLCWIMYDMKIFRHRLFECSFWIEQPHHISHRGKSLGNGYYCVVGNPNKRNGSLKKWKDAMGINWMTRSELVESVPPKYTEYIGKKYLEYYYGR